MQLTLSETLARAAGSFQAGHMDQAEALCRAILRADAGHLVALHLLAAVQTRLGRLQDALASYDRVLAIKPDYPEALNNRGTALHDLHRVEDALASYERALAIKPDYVEALNNRGNALRDLKRCEAAVASYEQALALNPGHVEALVNRGIALHDLERFADALASHETALAIMPDHVEALFNRGIALESLRQLAAALASYDKALAIEPNHVGALINRGNTLRQLKRFEEALASYDRALAIKPDHIEALINRGNLMRDLKRAEDALTSYGKALAIKPDHVEALICRGAALRALNRFDLALASLERALAIEPQHRYAFPALADCALNACDWTRTAKLEPEIRAHVEQQKSVIMPFTLLAYCSEPSVALKCARSWLEDQIPLAPAPLWDGTIHRHERVRIAYLSADFYRHATAYLAAGLFELHDRSRFEVLGVSFEGDDASDLRVRLVQSFDRFYDVTARSDEDAAKLLASLQVDIVVDLKGYTQDARTGILAHRPAPILISYLGYPGTMGASFMDYVIADATVLPFDQ
jgi:predicted O-linked N-acetylglucosamine transferase (SPINDLY family)